jgi:2-oxoisovalerate dehydrogenase E1 component
MVLIISSLLWLLVECNTFRLRGHEEASGTAYYPEGMIEEWTKQDPISNYEQFLLSEGILTQNLIEEIREFYKKQVDEALDQTIAEPEIIPNKKTELEDVYAPFDNHEILPQKLQNREIRFIDAISEAIEISMKNHPNLVLMGQDIAEYGGAFKITEGFVEKFGKKRVRNTKSLNKK